MSMNIDRDHFVNAVVPVANAFAGTLSSDVIKVDGDGIEFIIIRGAGTGSTVVTVLACSNPAAAATAAVTFWYKEIVTDPGDTEWTLATTTGFTAAANANAMFRVWVPADLIGANGYNYAQLKAVEGTANATTGCVLARIVNTRKQPLKVTVLT